MRSRSHKRSRRRLRNRARGRAWRDCSTKGPPRRARSMLAVIYNGFTEGFDTADLKDAKALLEELQARPVLGEQG
jgi:hypothetical protein